MNDARSIEAYDEALEQSQLESLRNFIDQACSIVKDLRELRTDGKPGDKLSVLCKVEELLRQSYSEPARPQRPPGTQNAWSSATLPRGNREEVLLIEDDANVRDIISLMLSTLNYRVSAHAKAEDALAILEQRTFDLVLVDLIMPKVNGAEFIRRMRHAGHELKTIIMTGSGSFVPSECERYASMTLMKPFDLSKLAEALRQCIPQQEAQLPLILD